MIVILRLTPQSRACCPPGGRRRTLALLIGIALFTVSGHALADYAAGAAFYAKKDYEHAFAVLLPAAQEGEAEAQFTMGVMYDVGQHVQVDKQAAFGWFRRAADQGHPNAQIRLSGMLFAGEGVSPDRQEAYKWALLAIDRLPLKKRDAARAFSRQIRPLLDDAQAAHAQAEAAVWQPRLPAMTDHDGATPRLIKTGTGVFMNDRGSLLTDLHVAWPCRRLLVSYGDATNEATIFTFDIALDLAVLDTAFRRVQTAVFAVAPSLLVGESVSIIGYALQETTSRAPISAQGTITAVGLSGNEDFFWTSASSRRAERRASDRRARPRRRPAQRQLEDARPSNRSSIVRTKSLARNRQGENRGVSRAVENRVSEIDLGRSDRGDTFDCLPGRDHRFSRMLGMILSTTCR